MACITKYVVAYISTIFFVFKNKTLNVLKIGYLRVCCKCFKFPKMNIKIMYVLHHLKELESVAIGFQKTHLGPRCWKSRHVTSFKRYSRCVVNKI